MFHEFQTEIPFYRMKFSTQQHQQTAKKSREKIAKLREQQNAIKTRALSQRNSIRDTKWIHNMMQHWIKKEWKTDERQTTNRRDEK